MARQMTDEQLLEMDKEELKTYLFGTSDYGENDLLGLDIQELIDLIVGNYETHLMHLHSECQGGDFDPMHPDETAEEFFEHEDH